MGQRKIATQVGLSKSTVHRRVTSALMRVPNSNHITELLCDRFRGCLLVDGKYISVKGHERKIPMIWAVDYFSHDVIYHKLTGGENYLSYDLLFRQIKSWGYKLKYLVCDELDAIYKAAYQHFPESRIQICTNHYKEGLRRRLQARTVSEHQPFMREIDAMFAQHTKTRFRGHGMRLYPEFGTDRLYKSILDQINLNFPILTNYYDFVGYPATNNLIELYNSHLQARLSSLKGFEGFESAELWLNGYVMNRRLRKFSDSSRRFAYLNGVYPLQLTLKDNAPQVNLLRAVVG